MNKVLFWLISSIINSKISLVQNEKMQFVIYQLLCTLKCISCIITCYLRLWRCSCSFTKEKHLLCFKIPSFNPFLRSNSNILGINLPLNNFKMKPCLIATTSAVNINTHFSFRRVWKRNETTNYQKAKRAKGEGWNGVTFQEKYPFRTKSQEWNESQCGG